MRELRNSNGFNLDWLAFIDLYLVTIWLIFEIDQSDSSWAELDHSVLAQLGFGLAWLGCDNYYFQYTLFLHYHCCSIKTRA